MLSRFLAVAISRLDANALVELVDRLPVDVRAALYVALVKRSGFSVRAVVSRTDWDWS